MKLIGIAGRRRAGKDTAASALIDKGYALIKFADPLKAMLGTLLRIGGIEFNDLPNYIEGNQKEAPLAALCGKTARHAMQTLGTEWGRQLISEDLWVLLALARASRVPAAVITDVRFPNEAEAIKRTGGTVIHIVRSDQPRYLDGADGHASEADTDSIAADFTVVNNSTIEDLQKKILSIVAKL